MKQDIYIYKVKRIIHTMRHTIRLNESELMGIIAESVRKVLAEDIQFSMYGQHYHLKGPDSEKKAKALMKKLRMQHKIENGEKIVEPKKRKKKAEAMGEDQASPKALAANVKKMVSDTSLKSIKGFIDHGQRQFSQKDVNDVVEMFKSEAGGANLFVRYNSVYRDIMMTVDEIESWGRKDEYAVYERARKLGDLLNKLVNILEAMGSVYVSLVQKRAIQRRFGDMANVIRGNGHSLGLNDMAFAKGNVFLSKLTGTLLSVSNMLYTISDNGRDPFDYDV